jgi:xylulokinase
VADLLLGYDVGTSSVKVGIYSPDGDLLAAASAGYPVHRPAPRHVEQDPDDYWTATVTAIRAALAALPAGAGRVAALGCCGQAPTLVLLDRAGRPVRPAIIWQDTRAAAEAAALSTETVDGGRVRADASAPAARLRWLAAHEPDTLARAAVAIGAKDYVTYRLTGELVADYWTARGLFSAVPEPGRPAPPPDPAVEPRLLPRCLFAHEAAGAVTAPAAAATGLPPGAPVAAGWSDGLAACLGTGALAAPGLGLDIAGTSEMIGLCAPARPAATALLTAPIPGVAHWAVFGPTQASGGALEWACRLIGADPAAAGALAAQAPPGAAGLVFLPYLEGERAPIWDPAARGLLFGLAGDHGPAHLIRAVLEGVACSVRHVLTTAEADAGLTAREVRTAGGGTRLALWTQLKADLTGRPFVTVPTVDVGTLGAAILGAVAAGRAPDLASAAARMVRLGAVAAPDPAQTARYGELYATYLALYPRLRDLMRPLAGQ